MPKQSNFELIVELLSHFTWWICLLLAVISYYGFKHLASIEVITAGMTKDEMLGRLAFIWLVGASNVFQYVAPATCVIAAIVSVFRRII